MPRPTIPLEPHRDQIIKWITVDKHKLGTVVDLMKSQHNMAVQKRTIERNLARWGIHIQIRLKDKDVVMEKLRTLFHESMLTDEQICELLNEAGHQIGFHTLRRLRKEMGFYKRILPGQEETHEQTIRDILAKEYEDDGVKRLSRNNLYSYLRQKYPEKNIVGRDRVFNIAREMNPECLKRHKTKDGQALDPIQANNPITPSSPVHSPPTQHEGYPPPHVQPHSPAPPPPDNNFNPDVHNMAIDPAFVNQDSGVESIHGTSRLESLQRENAALHQRVHQQDAEIDYLRQAYHELLARFNGAPPPSVNRHDMNSSHQD